MFTLQTRKVRLYDLAFSPDGGRLAVGGENDELKVWDLATRAVVAAFPKGGRPNDNIVFGPDGKQVFVKRRNADITAHGGETLAERPLAPMETAYAISWCADRRHAWCLTNRGAAIGLYRLDPFAPVWSRDLALESGPYRQGNFIAGSADGRRLICGHEDGLVTVFDGATGAVLHRPDAIGTARMVRVAMSPDGEAAAWCAWSKLHLLRLPPENRTATHELGKTQFGCVAWHPSGAFFATGHGDGKVDYWDGLTGERRASFDWGVGKLTALTFDAAGDRAAACTDRGTVVVWDVDR